MPARDRRSGADARTRLDALQDLTALLSLHASRAETASQPRPAASLRMLVVPSIRRPRMVVPGAAPRAAANAVLRHGIATTGRERAQRRLLSWTLRSGAGRWVFRGGRPYTAPGDGALLDHLGAVIGRPVVASMALTPPRANRKPVLHLLDATGQSVGFAKIGTNALTGDLVRHEADTLADLADAQLTSLRVPRVLYSGQWQCLQLLVLSPLAVWRGTVPAPPELHAAMREIAGLRSSAATHPLGGYAGVLRDRATAMQTPTDALDREALTALRRLAGELSTSPSVAALQLGSWHGDWTPWNCRQVGTELVVWDWERAAEGVPVGFDALHYDLQKSLVGPAASTSEAANGCLRCAAQVLAPWGIAGAAAELTAALYLIEIGLRYLADGQRAAGGRGGDVGSWIVPPVAGFVARQLQGGTRA